MSTIMECRIIQLKAMHQLMQYSNDERIYMTWIQGWIPDCPTEEDFIDCADNDETFELFVKLINNKNSKF